MRKKTEIHLAYIYIVYAMNLQKVNITCEIVKATDNYIITVGRKRLHAERINFYILINISQFTPNGSHEILL